MLRIPRLIHLLTLLSLPSGVLSFDATLNMRFILLLMMLRCYGSYAFPGFDKALQGLARRQHDLQSQEMIGNLIEGTITEVGRRVRDCLVGDGPCVAPIQKVTQFYPRQSAHC